MKKSILVVEITGARLGTEAAYLEKMSILPSFNNTLEKVSWIDVGERRFSLSISAPLGDLKGGGLQASFKLGEVPKLREWSKPENWLE